MKKQNLPGVFLLVIGLFWATLIYWIAVASMPYNPVSVPRIISINLQTVCPQGWAFFTRNPREELTYYYRFQEDKAVLQPYHNSQAANLFGIRRTARLESMELATLASSVKAEEWVACESGIRANDTLNLLPKIVVQNHFNQPKICGDILIEQKELVPWAWSKETQHDEVPSKIAKLLVICTH